MKKVICLLIGNIILMISCAKKEESDDGSSSTAKYVSSQSGVSASGSITIGSETLSGKYASQCYSGTTGLASDVTAQARFLTVTSNSSFVFEKLYFTDSSCTLLSLGTWFGTDNLSIGNASESNYQMSHGKDNNTYLVNTSIGETWLEEKMGGSVDFTIGTPKLINDNSSYKNLISLSGNTVRLGLEETGGNYPSSVETIDIVKQ